MEQHNLKGIVLSGRPYHIDPEINHGIDTLITGLGLCVLTEDSISNLTEAKRPIRVVNYLRVRYYNRAIIVIISFIIFFSRIWYTRIKDGFYTRIY